VLSHGRRRCLIAARPCSIRAHARRDLSDRVRSHPRVLYAPRGARYARLLHPATSSAVRKSLVRACICGRRCRHQLQRGADSRQDTARAGTQIPGLASPDRRAHIKGKCYSGLAQMLGTRSITERLAHLLHLVDTYGVKDADGILMGAFTMRPRPHGRARGSGSPSASTHAGSGGRDLPKVPDHVRRPDLLQEMRGLADSRGVFARKPVPEFDPKWTSGSPEKTRQHNRRERLPIPIERKPLRVPRESAILARCEKLRSVRIWATNRPLRQFGLP